ncbi:MAG: BsuPI-related putative proteinase inhibitor [Halobacteriaceae archaeon]
MLAVALDAVADPSSVTFTVDLTNAGAASVDLTFPTGQTVEVAVRWGGDLMWRYGDERVFTQAVRTETVAPGETRHFEAVWADPAPGEYEATATLTARDTDAAARCSVAVGSE